MRINFGYVAMSTILQDCSPSKTITVKNLSRIADEKLRIIKLRSLAKTNLNNIQRLFFHNKSHDITVFRLTSKLIPLATHPIAQNWDWASELAYELQSLGAYARENHFRLSAHPDHFTLLNSPKEEILTASIKDLEYHHQIFKAMGLDSSAKLVIHVGGRYEDKDLSMERFINSHHNLPLHLKNRIILENDDKIYTSRDVLKICQELKIPMVLDIHHHWCNNYNDDIGNYLPAIFDTWKDEPIPPKIHLSSPRDQKHFRNHADNIDLPFFLEFLEKAKKVNQDFDVMIEAKNKDGALFQLMRELKEISRVKFINEASVEA